MEYATSGFWLDREGADFWNADNETLAEWLNALAPLGFRLVNTTTTCTGRGVFVLAIMERADSEGE